MTSFTVGKLKCEGCGKEWRGTYPAYYINERNTIGSLCKNCFIKVKRFIKSIKK